MSKDTGPIVISSEDKKQARKFIKKDFDFLAESIIDEWMRRKRKRSTLEKYWKDIDRQIEMEPDKSYKLLPSGKVDARKAWMAEMELPLQAQALEVLSADAKRLMFPENTRWYAAKAKITDEYLDLADLKSIIPGDENEVPSLINQDNANKLIEGFLDNIFFETGFYPNMDMINIEAFKYGVGVGRSVNMRRSVYTNTMKGTMKSVKKLPYLVPTSIKKTYLDDRPLSPNVAQVLGNSTIYEDRIRYENIKIAAKMGSTDPFNENGGWITRYVDQIEPDNDGCVSVIEMEGDVIVPRKTSRNFVLPGAVVTVLCGKEGTKGVIRLRFKENNEDTYHLFPYHKEHIDNPYPASPLMKGRPVQIAAVDALNRVMDSAALKNTPPVGYDRNEAAFAAEGGPSIFPGAQWPTIDDLKVYAEVGGDPAALMSIFSSFVNLYSELTGVMPARLGAQTVSHTTAFAKDVEVQRGAARTVDYATTNGNDGLLKWVNTAYRIARNNIGRNQKIDFYCAPYDSYVSIDKDILPEEASFEFMGANGAGEEAAVQEARFRSAQSAIQLDQLNVALGNQPVIDIPELIKQILREGKWTDVETITNVEGLNPNGQGSPGIPGADGIDGGTVSTTLQNLAFGRR